MNNASLCESRSLLMMLAEINDKMIDISRTLRANPVVRKATRGCDIRMLRDPMRPEEERAIFESYVEVETQGGDALWWRLDISATSSLWKLYRVVGKPGTHGEDVINTFEEVAFGRFSEMRERVSSIVDEFVDSARTFDFAP